ncbi:hypothetical protein DYQ86_12500 [Acidobacteria bacterium AB60]|nr:hypothetical protein DYQ86_12500 [Acidobacteria bacterium AB60]
MTNLAAYAKEHVKPPSHFTGKERDSESGNDYFGARYYASTMGRWLSPDPSNWGIDFFYPQTWNHYSYVANNPLSATDPNGLWLTPTHNRIIDNAFPGLSKEQRQILKSVSKGIDDQSAMDRSQQFKHGMSPDVGPFDPVTNPEIDSEDWIERNEHQAKEIQDQWIASGHSGISPAALAAFGNALHTIADERSPAHAGFQRVNWWTLPWHVWREQNLFHQHDGKVQHAVGDAQTAFYLVFGTAFGDQATHESGKGRIVDWRPLPDQPK